MQPSGFLTQYRHGFIRVTFAIPPVRVTDPACNAQQTVH